jgi:hypothetical protein
MPVELRQAFRLTDRVLATSVTRLKEKLATPSVELSPKYSTIWLNYLKNLEDLLNGEISNRLEHSGKERLNLRIFIGLDHMWHYMKDQYKKLHPLQSDSNIQQDIVKFLENKNSLIYFNHELKYILIYGSVLEKQEKMNTKLQSSLLHEFIHGIDSASAPNLFKNSRYLRKNELVEQLGDADLSKILNTIYLEEHAYGQTIRSLNKKIITISENDLKTELESEVGILKRYWDVKKAVIQEIKRRRAGGALSKEAKRNNRNDYMVNLIEKWINIETLGNFLDKYETKIKIALKIALGTLTTAFIGLVIYKFNQQPKKPAIKSPTANPSNRGAGKQAMPAPSPQMRRLPPQG